VKFSSKDAQQSKDGMKGKATGSKAGLGWNSMGESNRAQNRKFSFLLFN
jgi:hypothetical protein